MFLKRASSRHCRCLVSESVKFWTAFPFIPTVFSCFLCPILTPDIYDRTTFAPTIISFACCLTARGGGGGVAVGLVRLSCQLLLLQNVAPFYQQCAAQCFVSSQTLGRQNLSSMNNFFFLLLCDVLNCQFFFGEYLNVTQKSKSL